ncbi:MAG TPA: PD-(D/E)XK nuclease family protein [Anaerolineales bacterium]|nr:PD-(D/E)XK nuclease family protein [Anaerolineales bacterium]
MNAPAMNPDLQFSQSSLQDFVDCQRRFQLRYLLRLAWPAVESEPVMENERHMRLGAQFHQMIHQHLLGVPSERLANMLHDEILLGWWENYQAFLASDLGQALNAGQPTEFTHLHPEIGLASASLGCRLVAKYDLIVHTPSGKILIFDWKTSRHRPKRTSLSERVQTRLYPYLLVQAGAHLNAGQPIHPSQIEMIYWFANFPEQPESFPYDDRKYAADEGYINDLLAQILHKNAAASPLPGSQFPLTSDEKRCRFCAYRSLCDRGVQAGTVDLMDLDDEDTTIPITLDLEQIGEIEF